MYYLHILKDDKHIKCPIYDSIKNFPKTQKFINVRIGNDQESEPINYQDINMWTNLFGSYWYDKNFPEWGDEVPSYDDYSSVNMWSENQDEYWYNQTFEEWGTEIPTANYYPSVNMWTNSNDNYWYSKDFSEWGPESPNSPEPGDYDENPKDMYLLINKTPDVFDSGMRVKIKRNIYQISTSYATHIIKTKFLTDNYYINITDINRLFYGLVNIFDTRVVLNNDRIILTSPESKYGITKMLVVGLNVEISYIDSIIDDVDDIFTFTTYYNGWCNYNSTNPDRLKANAMLLEFDPNRIYQIKFSDSYKNYSYDSNIKNCIFFGKDVEDLKNGDYNKIFHKNSFFTTIDNEVLDCHTKKVRDELGNIRKSLTNYNQRNYTYNYSKLEDVKIN